MINNFLIKKKSNKKHKIFLLQKNFFLFYLAFLFLLDPKIALGQIPPAQNLINKLSIFLIKRPSRIDQTVVFNFPEKPITLNETWWVLDSNTAKLQVTSPEFVAFKLNFLYKKDSRIEKTSPDNSFTAIKKTGGHLNELMWFEKPSEVKTTLLKFQIIPNDSFDPPPKSLFKPSLLPSEKERIIQTYSKNVTLERHQGKPMYRIGFDFSEKPNGIWIDQTTHQITRLISDSNCDVSYEYESAESNRINKKTYKLEGQTFIITADPKPRSDITKYETSFFEPKNLAIQNLVIQNLSVEQANLIEMFYQKCR